MTDENKTQVGFKVNADAYEKAKKKLEWGGMSRVLREKVHEVAYGTETTERARLKEKLNTLRKEKRNIDAEIDELRHERDETQREIERVEDRLDTLMEQDGEYDGFLQSIEEDLHQGKRFDPQHGKIETAANIGNTTPEKVIQDLKERNPEVPEKAFRLPEQHENPNWKGNQLGQQHRN